MGFLGGRWVRPCEVWVSLGVVSFSVGGVTKLMVGDQNQRLAVLRAVLKILAGFRVGYWRQTGEWLTGYLWFM